MKWLRRMGQPRLLAVLALAFSMVPVWVAFIAYREAQVKDEQLFDATAQVLAEQLRDLSARPIYYLRVMRGHAQSLANAALFAGQMQTAGFSWQERFPSVIAFGYAQQEQGKLLLRWTSEHRTPIAKIGDDLMHTPGLVLAPDSASRTQRTAEVSCLPDKNLLMVFSPLLEDGETGASRGAVIAWMDLRALCHDAGLPSIRDHLLSAAPKGEGTDAPKDRVKVATITIPYSSIAWDVVIERGPQFGHHYGGFTPSLAILAVALGTVPLLLLTILAGRAAKLHATLTMERELSQRQQFFTQSVSHEFRTPLSIILSGADLLERYTPELTPQRRAEVLEEMKDNIRQMNGMIENVLALGRIDAHKVEFKPQHHDVAAFCTDVVRKISTASHDRCPITVSAPDQAAVFDPALIRSVLDNLLSNAVKYSPPGSPVSLTAEVTPSRLTITVRDQGIGIPPQDLPRIGEMFHRSGNVGATSGAGLGLAIAQRYVSLMQGTLTFDSRESHGTTATVSLPCAEPPSPLSAAS